VIATLGYFAFILNAVGNLMLARRNVWGWIVRLLTNVAWIAYAVQVTDGEPMALNHAFFLGVNLYGFQQWRRS